MNPWTLLPTLIVRSTGFPWELVERLAHRRTAPIADRLLELTRAAEQLRGELGPGPRLSRGQRARLRSSRPLPPETPVPADWLERWTEVTGELAAQHERWANALMQDEGDVSRALGATVADPRFLEAVACSGPGVFRDIAKGRLTAARLRRQVASYAQRLATKCETMSYFGPINYAMLSPGPGPAAKWSWEGHRVCPRRRAYLSAWAFHQIQAAVLADPATAAALVPRRKTFAGTPAAATAPGALVRGADGGSTLEEISARSGLDAAEAKQALDSAMRRGLLTHDLDPAATEIDPTRWLAGRLPAADRRLAAVVASLDRYPAADAATKLALQSELARFGLPEGAGTPADGGRPPERAKFYNDRLPVTEAAVGTLDLSIGGELARDLQEAVPAVLDLLAHTAVGTRRRTNREVARALGPGSFPFTRVLRACAGLKVAYDPWLTDAIGRAVASAAPGTTVLDLAGLVTAPPPELPVLCSVDVMVAAGTLSGYRGGHTPLVIGDVHDAPLLTPWALQFHPGRAAALAERDRQILRVLDGRRALSVVARRNTGLPPLRFPGPVVEIGPVDGSAERIELDRLYVSSDGERARLRAAGRPEEELFLHNGELDTAVHTAFALPRIRPPRLPDADCLPRLRHGNVVLARSRRQLRPGPLTDLPERLADVDDSLALRRRLRAAGVPSRFFAKASHERKPVYVDLDSPLLVDGLLRLAAGAETLHASEVLPDRNGLWLREGDLRFAAELRCVYLRPGVPGAAR